MLNTAQKISLMGTSWALIQDYYLRYDHRIHYKQQLFEIEQLQCMSVSEDVTSIYLKIKSLQYCFPIHVSSEYSCGSLRLQLFTLLQGNQTFQLS